MTYAQAGISFTDCDLLANCVLHTGIIGDYNPEYPSHSKTVEALQHAAHYLNVSAKVNWIPTVTLDDEPERELENFNAFLCAPGSPYKSMNGALKGIEFVRKSKLPFLGTCGGFQHMVIEFARNAVGVFDAAHAEEQPESSRQYITALECSLKGKAQEVQILPRTRAAGFYGKSKVREHFNCSYGLNSAFRSDLDQHGLHASGIDYSGEVRILELSDYPFFIGTLYQPQLSSSLQRPHPLLLGLLNEAIKAA